jgi:hypothetical protein
MSTHTAELFNLALGMGIGALWALFVRTEKLRRLTKK